MNFETLAITETDGVAHIELNRPDKANALSGAMWKDMRSAFDWLSASRAAESCRKPILATIHGACLGAGIDLGRIKDTLNYSRDHSVAEGLSYVAAKNAAVLFS